MKHRFRAICTIVVSGVCQHCVTPLDGETQAPVAPVFSVPDVADHALVLLLPAPLAPGTTLRASMAWQSGAVVQRGSLQWLPTDNLLFFEPFEPLNPDLVYELVWSDALVYDNGAELRITPLSSEEITRLSELEVLPIRNRDTTDTIVDLLDSACASCHDGRALIAFTPQSLFRTSESDVSRPLIEPGETAQSVLIDRVVHSLPRRSGQAMPPAWSDVPALSDEEVRRIEAWILADCPDTL